MSNRVYLLVMLIFTLLLNVVAQDTFQGVVKYKMMNDGNETFLDYYTNGKDIKIDIKGEQEAIMLFDGENVTMVIPSQKMYMEFPASMLDMAKKMGMQKEKNADEFEVENVEKYRTGETKTINGYNCEKWLYENENGSSEIWVTEELGNFMFMQNPMESGGDSMLDKFNRSNYFPVQLIARDKTNKEIARMEATEITKMDLDSAAFKAPDEYKKMDMQGMMKMFQDQK